MIGFPGEFTVKRNLVFKFASRSGRRVIVLPISQWLVDLMVFATLGLAVALLAAPAFRR